MVRTFCTRGENEAFKGAVHATGGVLAALMAVYNATAWFYRREQHLRVNAIVYTLATLWEVKQTAHHFVGCDTPKVGNRALTLVPPAIASAPDCRIDLAERVA
jgi:hypothetical protein